MKPTAVVRSVGPRAPQFRFSADADERNAQIAAMAPHLRSIGIRADRTELNRLARLYAADGFGMDANVQASLTTASVLAPLQFLQAWLPGFTGVTLAARKIDEFVGMQTVGDWEDEEIIAGWLEASGSTHLYTDLGNIPYTSYNDQYTRRTIIRSEEGMRVGKLEELRAAKVKINSGDTKRKAASEALEVFRNSVGFLGFNNGQNNTYGLLNDPNLPAATAFPSTGSGGTTTWSTKDFPAITGDLRLGIAQLRVQSGDNFDPTTDEFTIGVATGTIDFLSVTAPYGNTSVRQWLEETYPKARVISAPELTGAISSQNAVYFYAEGTDAETDITSTDDNRTFNQLVQTKFMLVGVAQHAKGVEEDYSNATAGVLLKRPFMVARFYGN